MFNQLARFRAFWLAELVRRYELQQGSQETELIDQQVLACHTTEQRILKRAELLGQQLGLVEQLQAWNSIRRIVAFALTFIAVISAFALVRSSLALPQPISLSYALMLLLGIHILLFLLWFISLFIKDSFGWIGRLSMWLVAHFGKKSSNHSMNNALLTVAHRHQLSKVAGAILTHGYWTLFLIALWFVLFFHLSTNAYAFTWETTIWQADDLQAWVDVLAFLPALAGVEAPSVQALWGSNEPQAQLAAGRWLLACIFIYGVLWRLFFLVAALIIFLVKLMRMRLDLSLPGYAHVIRKYAVVAKGQVIDADRGILTDSRARPAKNIAGEGQLIISLDHEADTQWLSKNKTNPVFAGVIASSADKRQLLARLAEKPPQQITVRVNTQLSPDRAAVRLLESLKHYCSQVQVQLINTTGAEHERLQHWRQAIAEAELA